MLIDIENCFSPNDIKRTGGNRYQARCPAHQDKTASLTITVDNENIAMHCHAGCSTQDITESLGISMWDLTNKSPEFKEQYRQAKKEQFNKQQFQRDYTLLTVINSDIDAGLDVDEYSIQKGREAMKRMDKLDCNVDKLYENSNETDFEEHNRKVLKNMWWNNPDSNTTMDKVRAEHKALMKGTVYENYSVEELAKIYDEFCIKDGDISHVNG